MKIQKEPLQTNVLVFLKAVLFLFFLVCFFPIKLQSFNKLWIISVPSMKTSAKLLLSTPPLAAETSQPAKLFSRGISRKSGNMLSNHYADNCVSFQRATRPERCASFTRKHRPALLAQGKVSGVFLAKRFFSFSLHFCFADHCRLHVTDNVFVCRDTRTRR